MTKMLDFLAYYPPASEGSKEVANLTERKNPHSPMYGVKEFVCLSVFLSVTMCASSKNGEMSLFRPDYAAVKFLIQKS